MKTPEEIKKIKEGLKSCSSDECHGDHGDCPYKNNVFCMMTMAGEAMAYIEQLEERISLNSMRDAIYEDAVAHGLWESTDYTVKECIEAARQEGEPADQEDMMRGWAMEAIRREVNELEMTLSEEEYVEELADVIIASLSVAGKLGIDIDAAVKRKMEINKARPWKHGKETEHETRKSV